MRMMGGIVTGCADVIRLMVRRVVPMCGGSIKLVVMVMMMILASDSCGYGHCLDRALVAGCAGSNCATCRRSLRRVLRGGDTCGVRGVTFVGFTVAKTLREGIAGYLQLSYPVILVGSDCGEAGLGEGKRLEVLGPRVWCRTWRGWSHHHVTAGLVSVHRVQDYLQHTASATNKEIEKRCFCLFDLRKKRR